MPGLSSLTARELDRNVNLAFIMERDLHIHRKNANAMIAHGAVKLDGEIVSVVNVGKLTVRDLYGKALSVGRREVRLFGSRECPTTIFADDAVPQLELDV